MEKFILHGTLIGLKSYF